MTTRCEYTLTGFGEYFERRRFVFPEPLPASQVCSICSLVCSLTSLLPCGHAFCHFCVAQMRSRAEDACPIDHSKYAGADVKESYFSKHDLEELQFLCGIGGDKCDFVGTLFQYEHHLQNCAADEIVCPRCSCAFVRRKVLDHCRVCTGRSTQAATGPQVEFVPLGAFDKLDAIEKEVDTLRQELAPSAVLGQHVEVARATDTLRQRVVELEVQFVHMGLCEAGCRGHS